MTRNTQLTIGLILGALVGGLIGYQIGDEDDKKRENAILGVLIGALSGLGIAGIAGLNKDTRNYRLYKNGRLVYHGITGKGRVNTRMGEHIKSGKKFDSFDFDSPRTRQAALRVEKSRIVADRPKYNIQHK